MNSKKMPIETRKAMNALAATLEPSTDRAQCYTIANYLLLDDETIADRLDRDHNSADGAKRAATLMVKAGGAKEINAKNAFTYGTFVFEDDSEL